jgi:diguanylate cyclase (GGDEF)-like protein/PAS domain S-box-containing protein
MQARYTSYAETQKKRQSSKVRSVVFSAVFFILILVGGSIAYVQTMQDVLQNNAATELQRIIEIRAMQLEAQLDKGIEFTRLIAKQPLIETYFLQPDDTHLEKEAFAMFDTFSHALSDKMVAWANIIDQEYVAWANIIDQKYYVNGQYVVTYDTALPEFTWVAKTLERDGVYYEVDYDYFDRGLYHLYINTAVWHEGKGIGVIVSRIEISRFIDALYKNNIDHYQGVPVDIYFFNKEGVITGAEDTTIVTDKKLIANHLGDAGDAVFAVTENLEPDNIESVMYDNTYYMIRRIGDQEWYITASMKIDLNMLLKTSTSTLFIMMMLVILLIFVVFDVFIYNILNPLIRTSDILNTILNNVPNMFAIIDEQGRIVYISKSMAGLARTGNIDHITGKLVNEVFDEADIKRIFLDVLEAKKSFAEESRELSINGKTHYYKIISGMILQHSMGIFISIIDVTQLMMSSLTDELTKLPNRRFFNTRMADEWQHAIRGKYSIVFMMMDLDKFKNYNDTYGHPQGDKLLQAVAGTFASVLKRSSDFVTRLGGEEFGVLLPMTTMTAALKLAERIRVGVENLRVPLVNSAELTRITISIGLVCTIPLPTDYNKIAGFIEQADHNLYTSKNTGRNKVTAEFIEDLSTLTHDDAYPAA